MDHLSSCYFCGATLDAPLDVYRITDDSGEEATITLCQTCHRKVETVFDAAGVDRLESDTYVVPERERSDSASTEARVVEKDTTRAVSEDETTGEEATEASDESGDGDDTVDPDLASDIEAMAAAEDEKPGSDTDETLREEMEPDIPDEFESGVDTSGESAGEDGAVEDVGSEETDAERIAFEGKYTRDDGADSEAGDAVEREETGDAVKREETGDSELEDDEIDPEVLEADEVATGEKEVEDVLPTESQDSSNEAGSEDDADDTTGTGEESLGQSIDDEHVESTGQEETDSPDETVTVDSMTGDSADRSGDGSESRSSDGRESQSDVGSEPRSGDSQSGNGEPTARTSITALEYNKVMRLLQNREFPVERAEIVEVAASAYNLAESDCAEVIDLAVDRGLLEEEAGQLVRPE